MSGRSHPTPVSRPLRAERRRRFAIVASQFHAPLVRRLVQGATATLARAGVSRARIRVTWVPGAFELSAAAAWAARRRPRPDAIIALGVLLRGETPQYAVLANGVACGLSQVAVTTGVPATFGVIVAETLAQARARAGGRMGNRGDEAASAALALTRLDDHDGTS